MKTRALRPASALALALALTACSGGSSDSNPTEAAPATSTVSADAGGTDAAAKQEGEATTAPAETLPSGKGAHLSDTAAPKEAGARPGEDITDLGCTNEGTTMSGSVSLKNSSSSPRTYTITLAVQDENGAPLGQAKATSKAVAAGATGEAPITGTLDAEPTSKVMCTVEDVKAS